MPPPLELASTLLHSLPQAVCARDADRNILYLNPAAERLTGWQLADTVGHKCHEFFLDATCRGGGQCPVEAALRAGTGSVTRDVYLKARSGDALRVRVSAAWLDDPGTPGGIVLSITPLGSPGDAEALRASEERYRSLYQSLPGGALIVDRTDTIIEANRAACEIFGLAPGTSPGETPSTRSGKQSTRMVRPSPARRTPPP